MRTSILATVLSISLMGAVPALAQTSTFHVYTAEKNESLAQAMQRAENDLAYCNRLRFLMGLTKTESKHVLHSCVEERIKRNDRSKPETWKESVSEASGLCSSHADRIEQLAISAQIEQLGRVDGARTAFGRHLNFARCLYEELK